jgi:hypothetical protein
MTIPQGFLLVGGIAGAFPVIAVIIAISRVRRDRHKVRRD